MNAVIESALPSSRSLNNSYQFTIETKKTAQPLIFKVFALFENNLKKTFENLKIFVNNKGDEMTNFFNKNPIIGKHRGIKSLNDITYNIKTDAI